MISRRFSNSENVVLVTEGGGRWGERANAHIPMWDQGG